MSDKDELLKAQKAEIEKLKKELQEATKPSSLCSVIQVMQKSIKRNIHNFFFREDKMKDMDVKIKELQKELTQKEEELKKTSAELFAVVNFQEDNNKKEQIPDISFPQTKEEAIKAYFGDIDLRQIYAPEEKHETKSSDSHISSPATSCHDSQGLTNGNKVGVQINEVSDSQYAASNIQADGQHNDCLETSFPGDKPVRSLQSIDNSINNSESSNSGESIEKNLKYKTNDGFDCKTNSSQSNLEETDKQNNSSSTDVKPQSSLFACRSEGNWTRTPESETPSAQHRGLSSASLARRADASERKLAVSCESGDMKSARQESHLPGCKSDSNSFSASSQDSSTEHQKKAATSENELISDNLPESFGIVIDEPELPAIDTPNVFDDDWDDDMV